MALVKVKVDYRGIGEVLKSPGVRADLTRRAQQVLAQAQSTAPVDSGDYRASLHVSQGITDRDAVHIGASVPYAMLVEAKTGNLARALDAAR